MGLPFIVGQKHWQVGWVEDQLVMSALIVVGEVTGWMLQFSVLVQKVFPKRQALQFLLMIFVTYKSKLWHDYAAEHTHTQVPLVLLFDFFFNL